MKRLAYFIAPLFAAISAMAQPQIAANGILNSASYTPSGLPNSPIAQGSIFSIFGTNLGPDTAEFGFNYPLPTVTPTGQVSVSVTVNGTATRAIILYSGRNQINAVLPSSTPVGTGTVTVTYAGQTSAPEPIQVVASDFGVFAVNSAGTGPGIVTFADYSLVTVTKAANPGEVLIIWGTGLGPVSGNEGASALPGDMPSVPVEVFIGGKPATITYRGRSGCCAGLDQIAAVVPAGVDGCSVPVAVKINDKVSNTTTISVASGSRTCIDSTTGLTSSQLSNIFSRQSAAVGSVNLSRTTSTAPGLLGMPATTTTSDDGFAGFERLSFAPGTAFNPALFRSVSFGACTVSTFSVDANPFPGLTGLVDLDAGPAITVSGPSGTRTLLPESTTSKGSYAGTLGNGTPGNYLDPGRYTITGPGGADVGPFSAQLNLPASLVWTNQSSIDTVNRAAGQTVTWTGGDPNGYVSIDGSSAILLGGYEVSASFHCQAKSSDGSFTIPPVVLLSLPSGSGAGSGGGSSPSGSLGVTSNLTDVTFTAPGLDLGVATASSGTSKSVTYQ